MNREELEVYILNYYATQPDYPWADTPRAAVFRHAGNRKWFALVMEVPRDKLGLAGTEKLDIVNFKCDPILIASLRGETGIFPAYHMNKASWITAALDGSVPAETIELLLDVSYELTKPKIRRKTANRKESDDTDALDAADTGMTIFCLLRHKL